MAKKAPTDEAAGPDATPTCVGVWSEIGKGAPGHGVPADLAHQRPTPENSAELLFDDVI